MSTTSSPACTPNPLLTYPHSDPPRAYLSVQPAVLCESREAFGSFLSCKPLHQLHVCTLSIRVPDSSLTHTTNPPPSLLHKLAYGPMQVILQAIGSSGLFAAGGVAGVAGGGANMCDKHSAEHVGHEKAEKAGLRGVALSIASSIVGAYQPVGGFRFVYTVGAGATVGDGARHYIRIAQSEQETLRCVCVSVCVCV